MVLEISRDYFQFELFLKFSNLKKKGNPRALCSLYIIFADAFLNRFF